MKNLPLVFVGLFAALAFAWTGLALVNHNTLGRLAPIPEGGVEARQSTLGEVVYPRKRSGVAYQGARIYAEEGCFSCHTQQVRSVDQGSDIARKLALRGSTARDYINEARVMLGTVRVGSDLSNIGNRAKDANWLHVHLYNARLHDEYSLMPVYDFLYEERPLAEGETPSAQALVFPKPKGGKHATAHAPKGVEVLPTPRAEKLVAYLQSLKLDYPLPEAPLLEESF